MLMGASDRRKLQEERLFAVVFARCRRSEWRLRTAFGGLWGGFPPGGEVTREVSPLGASAGNDATGVRRNQVESLRAREHGGKFRFEATPPDIQTQKQRIWYQQQREKANATAKNTARNLYSEVIPPPGGGHSEVFWALGQRFSRRRVERGTRSEVLATKPLFASFTEDKAPAKER